MTKKNTKKALLLSVLSLVVCFSMLVGTTFAWFTDSVTSANNVIASGNLDIELEYWDGDSWENVQGADKIFNPEAHWEPGYADVVYFKISNKGSLALQYSFVMNVVKPGEGQNVNGEKFKLADYLQYSIIEGAEEDQFGADRAAAIAAATAAGQVPRKVSDNTAERATNEKMLPNTEEYFAVVVWMPETVGNEANHKPGTPAPKVELTFNLIATQTPYEEDAFGDDYDDNLSLDWYAVGVAYFNSASDVAAEAVAINGAGYNVASAVIDKDSLAANVDKATLRVNKSDYVGNFTVTAGYTAEAYDLTLEGIKADNTIMIKTGIKIAGGLDPATVKVYHYDEELACEYNYETGWVTFETATFSPFTVVYDANSEYVAPEIPEAPENQLPEGFPQANVSEYTPTEPIEWGNYGQWSPTEGVEANLDAIYKFACIETPEEADLNKFADWHCDFYVKLDKDLGENEIFLGGNYGSFGWVGFHNGDLTLEANTELGLLESVTTNPWTYAEVAEFVGEFICGVGNVGNSLEGATFTVMLRLTNPENSNEFYNVATITYTWAGNTASN